MTAVDEAPRRPADAYFVMATELGGSYFLEPFPRSGVAVKVAGADGVPTLWHLSSRTADRVIPRLRRRRDARVISATRFEDTP